MNIKIVSIFPDVLGTYGDQGNARVLEYLARSTGATTELVSVGINDVVPVDGDLYLLGGGEDGPQALAARRLQAGAPLQRVVERGRPILAICAGYQILGRSFVAEGKTLPGLNILPADSVPATRRMVGEVLSEPLIGIGQALMTGFENHGSMTVLDDGVEPLARIRRGSGNGRDGYDGVIVGSVIGSYMHGPILARNPGLACHLLSCAGLGEVQPSRRHRQLHHERARAQIESLWRTVRA
ncbi:MAG: type 1 glutamine amidotransferase [Ferrimicrobium sp.]|jgi:hypothetical protein|uniref:Lipid II isoglutaminyl synthase (glutamine-hydrolyzing) subunit GatD n=1 Tax=Ferrimicrobium acidiphilum TaxID=121039 RepID=A0ABV3Y4K2_9ACTN|nr:DJ-1/PfpI family protein [Ferrimicrobium sp.]